MSALDFYKLEIGHKKKVFKAIGNKIGIPDFAVEKDWWVVQTLNIIFQMPFKDHLQFKGGTSLSKVWQLIKRFSEDVDLALNREYLGFDTGLISKTQVRKLRSKSFEFVTKTFYEMLKLTFKKNGFETVTFTFENIGDSNQDPVSILVRYPHVMEYDDYMVPNVKVEIGSRSLLGPLSKCKIISYVGEEYSDRYFADAPITISCVNPERTYLEKLFLLHEEFQKPDDKIRSKRLSRHLYDITQIFESIHLSKVYDWNLISLIIEHRKRFSGLKGVDYNELYPPNLNPVPPERFIGRFREDYRIMRRNMIPGFSPTFDGIINLVKKATEEYNRFKT